MLAVLAISLASPGTAHAQIALNPDPGSSSAPGSIYDAYHHCDERAYNPNQWSEAYWPWLAPKDAPSATSMTVPYGTSSVDLSFNYTGIVCLNQIARGVGYNAVEARLFVYGSSTPGVTNLSGGSLYGIKQDLNFGSNPDGNVGRYRGSSIGIRYAPPGGFTESKTYIIKLTTRSINYFNQLTVSPSSSGAYNCINGQKYLKGWDYDSCPPDTTTLTLKINISPPPVTVQTHVYTVNADGSFPRAVTTGVTYETCNALGNATQTGVNGISGRKDFNIPRNTSYCIRIKDPPPAGYAGPYIRPENIAGLAPSGYGSSCGPYSFNTIAALPDGPPASLAGNCSNYATYEWQESFAADNTTHEIAGGEKGVWDRGTDRGFDFVYVKLPPLSCDSVLPSDVEAGVPFSVQLGAVYNGPNGPIKYFMTNVTVPGQSPFTPLVAYTAPERDTISVGGQPAGSYTIKWTLASSLGTTQCQGVVNVGNHPYLKIYGNDVAVGDEFQNSSGCTEDDTARPTILTLGNNDGSNPSSLSPNYTGSSTQFAAYTIGAIDQFYTAGSQNPSTAGGSSVPPVGLTFGNYGLSNSSQGVTNLGWLDVNKAYNYGGLGSMQRCVPDYYSKLTSGSETNASTTSPTQDGWYKPNSSYLTISGGSASGQHTIAVDGDVYITGNITYDWSAGTPSLYIVAKGNIYIDPSVTQLAGVYVAQPTDSSGNNGVISTCANLQGGQLKSVTASNLFTTCNDQLTISGAFIAQKVQFLRSYGTVNQATPSESYTGATHAAEIFDAGPELYLNGPSALQTNANTYDSITSLPPIF